MNETINTKDATAAAALTACRFATVVGDALLVVNARGAVRALQFIGEIDDSTTRAEAVVRPGETVVWADASDTNHPAAPAVETIAAFLRGETDGAALFALPRDSKGTAFQESVWEELCRIPLGQTITYGELSKRVTGDTKASRAVGRANGTNPIALIVPCHRVVGANGSLTGYAWGTGRKAALLDLERAALTDAK